MRTAALLVTTAMLASFAALDDASAQWRKRDRKPESRSTTPIACTAAGCAPIPAGCRIETGFTQDGMLSGYDSVVCPVR